MSVVHRVIALVRTYRRGRMLRGDDDAGGQRLGVQERGVEAERLPPGGLAVQRHPAALKLAPICAARRLDSRAPSLPHDQ